MKVFCRFAPSSSGERELRIAIDKIKDDETEIEALTVGDPVSGACASISCERVFFPGCDSQNEIYSEVVRPMVLEALAGGTCSLLAYGQTSTGKTHTMFGPDGGNVKYFSSVDGRGIVPRVAQELFLLGEHGLSVEVRYFELYNENATDLVAKVALASKDTLTAQLHRSSQKIQITYKATEKQRLSKSLQGVTVTSGRDCLQVVGELSAQRSIGDTEANLKSTRSHVVIQMNVRGPMRTGQITFVDLAGSESLRNSMDHASHGGKRLSDFEDVTSLHKAAAAQTRHNEMKHINTSLFTLKKVVHALAAKHEHIPVKESLLTVVLEQSLQLSSSAMIVCCSALSANLHETLASLRLGAEASQIPPMSASKAQMQRCLSDSRSTSFAPHSMSFEDIPLPSIELPAEIDFAEEVDTSKDNQIKTLTIQCRHLANAYDCAMEEIGRLRNALHEMTLRKRQLEIGTHIVKNSLRLSSNEQCAEPRNFALLCEYEEPPRSFGAEVTNVQHSRPKREPIVKVFSPPHDASTTDKPPQDSSFLRV